MRRTLVLAVIAASLAAPVSADARAGVPPAAEASIQLDWAETPKADELERFYPPEALDHGKSGDALIECTVEPDGTLLACDIVAEKPDGMGFGPAAIRAAHRFRMKPYPAALIHGALPRVRVPVHWAMIQAPQTARSPRAQAGAATFSGAWSFVPVYVLGIAVLILLLLMLQRRRS
jgi:TonB family protein